MPTNAGPSIASRSATSALGLSQTFPRRRKPGDLELHEAVKRIEVRLCVLPEVADVLPVALGDVAVQRPAHLQQQREELLGEVVRLAGGHVSQHFGLDHVDARVDRVGEDLAPRRLLEETFDAAVGVGDDDAELERVLDRLSAIVTAAFRSRWEASSELEVDVAERVPGDDEHRLVSARTAWRTEPAVPSGDSSTEYETFIPSASPSPK